MIKIKTADFLKSAVKASDFPDYSYPEFAFFGRSNVGKSSLINTLTGRKSLLKVGAKPGVTKMINFFIINGKISLVDMPGYGYAKLPKKIKNIFIPLMQDYIKKRDNLRLTFLLIDIRRKPEEYEKELISFLSEHEIPIAIIATKCDKLSKNQRAKQIKIISIELGIGIDSIFLSSSKSNEGKNEIHRLLGEFS